MAPPAGPSNGDRALPTGPSSNRYGAGETPSGPSSMSAAPAYPRGGYGGGYRGRGGSQMSGARDYPSRDYPPRGGGYAGSYGHGTPYDRPPTREGFAPRDSYDSRGAPPGPRPASGAGGFNPPPMFRSSNSTSTTYPKTMRFDNQLEGVAKIKPGGQRLPPVVDTSKADKLEEEAARLRKLIDDKQTKKRAALKEWEKLEDDVKTAALRSELADEHLRTLSGETTDGLAAAAF